MDLMNNILSSKLGEKDSKLKITFKKTIKVREYETEVIEATNEIDVDSSISGIERVFISEILKVQLEYTIYVDLLARDMVTQHEFDERVQDINNTIWLLMQRASELRIDVGKYIGTN